MSAEIKNIETSLGQQKKLAHVYIANRKLSRNRFNFVVFIACGIIVTGLYLIYFMRSPSPSSETTFDALKKISNLVFLYGIGITGFLIASFAGRYSLSL